MMTDEQRTKAGDAEVVRLTLRGLPSSIPFDNRLRSALKTLLRSFGLRCVRVEDVPPMLPVKAADREP